MASKRKKVGKAKYQPKRTAANPIPLPHTSVSTSSSNDQKGPHLPIELILDIFEISAYFSGTQHARNICLVSKLAHQKCWPALHRIVALRTHSDLYSFTQSFYSSAKLHHSQESDSELKIRKKQSALRYLYINNNAPPRISPDDTTYATCLVWIFAQAENLERFHLEEHWSTTNE